MNDIGIQIARLAEFARETSVVATNAFRHGDLAVACSAQRAVLESKAHIAILRVKQFENNVTATAPEVQYKLCNFEVPLPAAEESPRGWSEVTA